MFETNTRTRTSCHRPQSSFSILCGGGKRQLTAPATERDRASVTVRLYKDDCRSARRPLSQRPLFRLRCRTRDHQRGSLQRACHARDSQVAASPASKSTDGQRAHHSSLQSRLYTPSSRCSRPSSESSPANPFARAAGFSQNVRGRVYRRSAKAATSRRPGRKRSGNPEPHAAIRGCAAGTPGGCRAPGGLRRRPDGQDLHWQNGGGSCRKVPLSDGCCVLEDNPDGDKERRDSGEQCVLIGTASWFK